MAAALVLVLCFFMAFASPVFAASQGQVHHVDTKDYCLRASDVTVNLSELQGLDQEQKQALVENVSSYAIYKWSIPFRQWGDPVSGSGDFSAVSWDRAGDYKITVRMPALTEKTDSEVSYTLTIVDDLPTEPEPPVPAMYRVTVRFMEEETGVPIGEDYVSDEIEEGSALEIGDEILLPPEGYTAVEIQGDLEGEMISDREILVICRKLENGTQEPEDPEEPKETEEPEDPQNPDSPGGGNDIDPEDPEPGHTDTPEDPDDQGGEEDPKENHGTAGEDNSGSGSGGSGRPGKDPGRNPGKNSGKNSSAERGNSSGGGGSSKASSGNRNSIGRSTKVSPSPVPAAPQSEVPAAEAQIPQTFPREETAPAAAETVPPSGEEEVPAPAREEPGTADTALAGEKEAGDQSSIGGALLPQAEVQKERYPLWSMTLSAAEGGILAVLGGMIISDLRVLLWLKEKKRR